MGRKFGWHSGKLICKELVVQNSITLGSLDFGSAELDSVILNGRMSTSTVAGAALSIGSDYSYGELIELRATCSKTDNTQFQGLFIEVRTSAANSSTLRGCEIKVAQEGAVAVGVLEGGNFVAMTRSATTGNITSMYGLTGEVTHNSNAYTGTITTLAAVRGKASLEDGTTYTNSSVFLAEAEAITGADTIGSAFRARTVSGITFSYAVDVKDATLEETNSGKNVTLIRFTGANGSAYRLVHDTDAPTAVSVVAD